MARYLSLVDLKRRAGSAFPEDLLSENGARLLSELIRSEAIRSQLLSLGYSEQDLQFFKSRISPESLLFQQWIESNTELFNFLKDGKAASYTDRQGIAVHRLFSDFQRYISPYLSEQLLSMPPQGNQQFLLTLSSYLPLLDEDHCAVVEDSFFVSIRRRLEHFNDSVLSIRTEQELLAVVQELTSDDIIEQLNSLSKASYVHKINYVDTLLKTVYAPGCSPRLANWLIKRMELLDLNTEHQDKIRSLKRDLAEGKLKVHNTTYIPVNRAKRIITGGIFIALAALVFFIWYFKPFSDPILPDVKDPSSFTAFTVEERKEIDSIIQEINQGAFIQEEEGDPGVFYGGGTVLTLRKAFQNTLLEKIYEDLSADAHLNYLYPSDSCEKGSGYSPYVGTRPLKDLNSGKRSTLRNESDYDAIIYIAENQGSGKVYAARIKSGETLRFSFPKNAVFFFAIGKRYTRYMAPAGAAADQLPSVSYTHHFCEMDANFEESINSAYRPVKSSEEGKFVLVGKTGQQVRFIDVTHITEAY